MLNISEDLTVTVGRQHTQLSPAEAFRAAEKLIRAATAAIVTDAADHALVRTVLRDGARSER